MAQYFSTCHCRNEGYRPQKVDLFLPCTCIRQGTAECKVQERLERCGDT
jgi:hypothetical protein